MGLANSIVQEHMDALFGKQRANDLRNRLNSMQPSERELAIVEEIAQALKEMGGKYVLPFSFKNESGKRTSHHLIFVSKSFKGYEIMKEIMAKECTDTAQGVPSFVYSPASIHQRLLFELSRPLENLAATLLDEYAGRTLTMERIYEEHNVSTSYIKKNYKDALLKLESAGRISANPSVDKRKKNTFGDKVQVTFPAKGI